MDTCSLLLYLDGCASCTFTARQFGRGEPVGLAASAPFLPGNHARGKRKLRSPRRNG
jgi:hypothetical protein